MPDDSQEIPPFIMLQLETAQSRFVDKKVFFKDGQVKTAVEAYPLQNEDNNDWYVVVDYSDRTYWSYEDLITAIH